MGSETEERYRKLGLSDALSRPYDYAPACNELSCILRAAYSKLPKNLQSQVFRDTLSAFRLLPGIQTNSGASSAYLLVQAADAALPKQRKALAISEFKHAVVIQKRRAKAPQILEGSLQLPYDILVHTFALLDVRSLVTVSLVCRAWNLAAIDDNLWWSQYSIYFGKADVCFGDEEQFSSIPQNGRDKECLPILGPDWREVFKRKFLVNSWSFTSSRMYCESCKELIWLSNMTCFRRHQCPKSKNQSSKMKPILHHKVADYLIDETALSGSSSDSDDDSDESSSFPVQRLPKLWAYPKHVGTGKQQFIR